MLIVDLKSVVHRKQPRDFLLCFFHAIACPPRISSLSCVNVCNVDLIKKKIIYIDSIAKSSQFVLLARCSTGDDETENFFLIPLVFLQRTAFITRSLDACSGLVLSGCRWLHGVRSASAPESISL